MKQAESLWIVRLKRFYGIKRARFAMFFMVFASVLALMAPVIANDRPLLVRLNSGIWYIPIFQNLKNSDLGETNADLAHFSADFKRHLENNENVFVIWPLIRWGANESNSALDFYPGSPSAQNIFGTDDRGRDLVTRLLYGYRVSLTFAFATLLVAVAVAVLVGGVQGYLGGLVDLIGQRGVEVWSALPYLYVLILLVNIYDPGVWMLILSNAMFAWITLSYYVRAEVLRTRKCLYVEAVRALGGSHQRILLKHILPNSLTPIVTFAPFIMNIAINNLAVLDYLGLGVQPPTASLGELLRQGKNHFSTAWWLAVYPFIVLVSTTIAVNFIGEGLREAFAADS